LDPEHDDLVLGSFDTESFIFVTLMPVMLMNDFSFSGGTSRIASWMISVYRPHEHDHCTATDGRIRRQSVLDQKGFEFHPEGFAEQVS